MKRLEPPAAAVPPPKLAMLAELPRAIGGVAQLVRAWPALRQLPRGDGRPVVLLPGLFNSDRSNVVLRRYLEGLGYRAEGWGLGRNFGVRVTGGDAERLVERIDSVVEEAGQPATLVGVSLGGIMARLVAHRHPRLVRAVVTISAPFAGPPSATNVWRQFQWLTGEKITDPAVLDRLAEAARPLPVPATAIWSRSDGMVNGLICRESHGGCADVEVRSSHLWVQMNPDVLRAVADALARS